MGKRTVRISIAGVTLNVEGNYDPPSGPVCEDGIVVRPSEVADFQALKVTSDPGEDILELLDSGLVEEYVLREIGEQNG